MTHYPPELFEGFTPGDRLNPHSRSARHRKYGYDLALKHCKEKEMTEYPKEIYKNTHTAHERNTAEEAYELGLKHAESLGDWSNLTQAIQDGVNIDWEKLDGREAKCVHPQIGILACKLERDEGADIDTVYGWHTLRTPSVWRDALINAWDGMEGWSLCIKGKIPLKRKTADQLPLGMCLRSDDGVIGILFEDIEGKKAFWGANRKIQPAAEIIVAHEYGIGSFQKKEEK